MKKHWGTCKAKDKVCMGCKQKGRTPAHCPCQEPFGKTARGKYKDTSPRKINPWLKKLVFHGSEALKVKGTSIRWTKTMKSNWAPSGAVSMGLMGLVKPIDFLREVLEAIKLLG